MVDPVLSGAFDRPATPRTRPATPRTWPATPRTGPANPANPRTGPANPCAQVLCGVFVHAARMRQLHPVLTYCRAALRLATLAATLPRERTRLTAAGRSQLAAYLFHDSVFPLSP